ncbi:hypothetical protein BC834DRAFT_885700 [Gloeopeniophorella convolvens]|nr:hypothetical protein BC834DRAFT_885700 [Gloeopeniophorella convolvens]
MDIRLFGRRSRVGAIFGRSPWPAGLEDGESACGSAGGRGHTQSSRRPHPWSAGPTCASHRAKPHP